MIMRPSTLKILLLAVSNVIAGFGANQPPSVVLAYSHSGDLFTLGMYVKVKAEATDAEGPVASVSFYANGTLIGTATNSPFVVVWQVPRNDDQFDPSWTLRAIASDSARTSSESKPVTINYRVGAPALHVSCRRERPEPLRCGVRRIYPQCIGYTRRLRGTGWTGSAELLLRS
jgi:hypothetical protein